MAVAAGLDAQGCSLNTQGCRLQVWRVLVGSGEAQVAELLQQQAPGARAVARAVAVAVAVAVGRQRR